jgi:hypothetical protein
MQNAPTALHRVAAWCAAALFFALVAVGTRTVFRALVPGPEPGFAPEVRVEAQLADVEEPPRGATGASPDVEASAEVRSESSGTGGVRQAIWAPGHEPLEKHPYFEIEGVVHSATGTYRERIALVVEHPGGEVSTKDLHFDRRSPDDGGWIARFKLIKPAQGSYVLRPRRWAEWPYTFEPGQRIVTGSTSDLTFVVRDDVEHVDLVVRVTDTEGNVLEEGVCNVWLSESDLDPWRMRAPSLRGARGSWPDLRHVPVGLRLRWFAGAPGHRPARGEFEVVAGQSSYEIRLEPGWGTYLEEGAPNRGEPPGEVWLDGRCMGPTDPSGSTYVWAHSPPRELRVWFEDHWAFELSPRDVNEASHLILRSHRVPHLAGYPPSEN